MSGGVYGGDEVGALVFDLGTHSGRAGFAGEDMPKYEFPSTIGVVEDAESMETEDLSTSAAMKKYYIDTVNVKVARAGMEIVNYMQDGMIDNWDIFEKIMDYSYAKHVKSDPLMHPVLMSEASWNARGRREKLTEIMFEKYNIPAFFLSKSATLSAFANGRSTALVLDSGSTCTSAVPVYDGYVQSKAIVKSPLAGTYVATEAHGMLKEMGIDVVPPYQIKSKEMVNECEPPEWVKKPNLPPVTKSFQDYSVREVVEDFVASTLQVYDQPYDKEQVDQMPGQAYEFPCGSNRDFQSERFKLVEGLFDPNNFIKDFSTSANTMMSMTQVVTTSVGHCDIDIRPSLYSSVVVVGGNSLLNGFTDRLNRDLGNKIPSAMRLKLIHSAVNAERRFCSWIGGSILASLGSFQQMWISKQEYEESGKSVIEKKCP